MEFTAFYMKKITIYLKFIVFYITSLLFSLNLKRLERPTSIFISRSFKSF